MLSTHKENLLLVQVSWSKVPLTVLLLIEGNFQLNTEKKGSLVISYIGYVTKEVTIKPTLKIVLAEDTKALDEVVVVGYGTQKKSDLTGSVTSVKAAEITAVTSNNPLESLQGRAPGVAVFTNNAPGESPILRIRGAGSIQSGNDPLYVVDGFPLMNGSLNDINPADIASMEILRMLLLLPSMDLGGQMESF